MSPEDLIRAATVERKDYQSEALELIDKELATRNVSTEQITEVRTKAHLEQEAKDRKITGIRGWLLVFVILIAICSLSGITSGLSALGLMEDFPYTAAFIPLLPLGCYGIVVFILLILKKFTAPDHARACLMIFIVYNLLICVAGITNILEFRCSPFPAIWAGMWVSYMKESKRVALTYKRKTDQPDQGPDAGSK